MATYIHRDVCVVRVAFTGNIVHLDGQDLDVGRAFVSDGCCELSFFRRLFADDYWPFSLYDGVQFCSPSTLTPLLTFLSAKGFLETLGIGSYGRRTKAYVRFNS